MTCHLHKDAEAYKFLSSGTYKNAIAIGKVTNVVAPLVSNIMTQYVVYKRFITTTSNKYNSNKVIVKVDGQKYKIDAALYHELTHSSVKFTLKDVVMISKTSDGKLLWLEKGNENVGLKHILSRHNEELERRGVTDIPQFIESLAKQRPIKLSKNSRGYEATYLVSGKKYLLAYGTNGFIVTFYPML